MADYITAITGLINMASGLSNGMLVYILIFALLCILTWKLPELIKALRKDDDDDQTQSINSRTAILGGFFMPEFQETVPHLIVNLGRYSGLEKQKAHDGKS